MTDYCKLEQLKSKLTVTHHNQYDYSLWTEWCKSNEQITVRCKKHNTIFTPILQNHKNGSGCPECGRERKSNRYLINHTTLVEQSQQVHGDTYTYIDQGPKRRKEKWNIKCTQHGVFNQCIIQHLQGQGCPQCGKEKAVTSLRITKKAQRCNLEDFIKQSSTLFNNKYNYDLISWNNGLSTICTIQCPIHGKFKKKAGEHLNGSGCRKCVHEQQIIPIEQYIDRCNETHKRYYNYDKLQQNTKLKDIVVINCPKHGDFSQVLFNHINGAGCKQCKHQQYSDNHIGTHPKHDNYSEDVYSKLNDKHWLMHEHHIKHRVLGEIAKELNVHCSTLWGYYQRHNIEVLHFHQSVAELEIMQFINEELKIKTTSGTRTIIPPYELDIYSEEYKIAIEYNGNYWHSECSGNKSRNYHLNKTELCEQQGIQLIHIFEHDWTLKAEIVKSRLRNIFKQTPQRIYARKTKVVQLRSSDVKPFINENHLQGSVGSSLIYGLVYNDNIVSVMTFSKPRFNTQYDYELVRFCNKLNTNVIGAASRLFKAFNVQHSNASVISYADRTWSGGNVYKQLNFEKQYNSCPSYRYFKLPNITITFSRNKFQKHKLKTLLDVYDESKTEWENMKINGYDRIWNCGNVVWTYSA